MANTIYIKKDDTAPDVQATLLDANDNPVDIQGATVRFIVAQTSGTVLLDAPATNEQVSSQTRGQVSYNWQQGDTSAAGSFNAEWEVTYANGEWQTFPTQDYIKVQIVNDLGGQH